MDIKTNPKYGSAILSNVRRVSIHGIPREREDVTIDIDVFMVSTLESTDKAIVVVS